MARKSTPTIVLFAILFIAILFGGSYLGFINLGYISSGLGSMIGLGCAAGQICVGSTIVSISYPVSYISNDPELQNKKAFLINLVVDGGADSVVGTFSKNKIVDSVEAVQSKSDIQIGMQKQYERCTVAYSTTSRQITEYEDFWPGGTKSCSGFLCNAYQLVEECMKEPDSIFIEVNYYTGICKVLKGKGTIGTINDATRKRDFNIAIGISKSTNIEYSYITPSNPKVEIRSNNQFIGNAKLISPLPGIEMCPTFDNTTPSFNIEKNRWYTSSEDDKDIYINYNLVGCIKNLGLPYSSCPSEAVGNFGAPNLCAQYPTRIFSAQGDCFLTYNQLAENLFNNREPYTVISDSSGTSGILYKEMQDTMRPQIALRLDASWVGILELVGNPVLSSKDDGSCVDISQGSAAGGTGILKATVKNDSTQPASFDISANCPTLSVETKQGIAFAAGEIKTVSLDVYSGIDKNETCTIRVSDTIKTSNYDECKEKIGFTSPCPGISIPLGSNFSVNPNTCEIECYVTTCSGNKTVDKDTCTCVGVGTGKGEEIIDQTTCENKSGYHWVETKTPIWWGLFGESVKGECVPNSDYTLVMIAIITAISILLLAIIFRKGPVKNAPIIKQTGEGLEPLTKPLRGRRI